MLKNGVPAVTQPYTNGERLFIAKHAFKEAWNALSSARETTHQAAKKYKVMAKKDQLLSPPCRRR